MHELTFVLQLCCKLHNHLNLCLCLITTGCEDWIITLLVQDTVDISSNIIWYYYGIKVTSANFYSHTTVRLIADMSLASTTWEEARERGRPPPMLYSISEEQKTAFAPPPCSHLQKHMPHLTSVIWVLRCVARGNFLLHSPTSLISLLVLQLR